MLQQTRVETASPYFERFMESFPSVEALADAELESVLSLWSGLGYYQRARRLHAAARRIVEAGGEFPSTLEAWKELPGVGPYTASAIASIVLGICEPAIDGNVMRVVARLLALEEDPKRRVGAKAIESTARALLDEERPGDSNQAIMELGATICRPRRPRCSLCPLESDCRAASAGNPERYPISVRRVKQRRQRRQVAVVVSGQRLLLFRRPEESRRMAGIWELPWVDEGPGQSPAEGLGKRYGGRWELGTTRGRVQHSVTDRLFRIEVVEARLISSEEVAEAPGAGWFSRSELEGVPTTGLVAKVLELLDR